ncbi:MAG TPA: DUF6600 domain-containing protein [Acidobacteriota bacterium]|nr:DUF6600 domain-containing protein [Acidobacteriota bacterium]
MYRNRSIILALLIMLLLSGARHNTLAQADPPDRVARLNFVEGNVSFLPSGGDEDDWVAAVLNRPLTTGDRLWADANSQAELHIGPNAIRIDSNTGISFLNLDDTTVQIRLSDGSVNVRLRRLDPGNTLEVDTPNVAFAIKRPGNYRIDAHPDNNATIATVYQGEAEAIGGGRSWQVISDQQAFFTGTDTLEYDLKDADAQPLGDFDRWARSRDEQEDRIAAATSPYVSPEMTGYEDLNAYGTWTQVPEYGWCWYPSRVVVGWAPYRFGHWVWIAPWGWTWVDDEPWGFAPFHYGRWAYYRAAWIWVPGPIAVRPVYAPALVAWVGGRGFSFSVSVGGGPVGWFPLGPREVFVPAYHVSERYVTNINVTNTVVNRTTVINVYNNRNYQNAVFMNRAAPGALTVVSRDTFVTARPVARNVVSVPARELASAPISRTVEAAPERASVYGAGSHNAPRPPARVMDRPVVARQTPPPPPNHFGQPQNRPLDRPPGSDRPSDRTVSRPPDRVAPARPSVEPPRVQQPARSQVRPAPPVRPPTAKERSDIQAKQKSWENAHPRNNKDQKEKRDSRRN